MKAFWLLLVPTLGCVACGETSDGQMASTDEIQATQEDDVWMFFSSPEDHDNALHSGRATIQGGCLFIGEAVVVWHGAKRAEAEQALAAAKAGSTQTFTLGGGGISLDEGDATIPEEIAEHCETREVWFGSPE